MIKPKWDEAPKWANWLAQDADASWWWFATAPYLEDGEWHNHKGTRAAYQETDDIAAAITLEQRP